MSAMKEQDWVELSITLTRDDLEALADAAAYGGDSSGIIEHILTLAKDKQAAVGINQKGGLVK